ncbi:GIY-YIG nuclease family protein [Microbacterium sp. P02]|uniref:GIY-YIG nuclease family protein n=1 Tax=Microbacterium sp. P02 TaxID=3366260 RepID=UPI00366B9BFA
MITAMRSTDALEALLDPSDTYTRAEVLARSSAIPAEPGLYAWYFDEPVPGVPLDACHTTVHGTLLYVGISPGPPPRNGRSPSRQNLYKRIRYHYTGNAAGSTLRLTLGCHLGSTLGIDLRRVGSGDRLTFSPAGEVALSEWMARHARVAFLEHAAPWEVEPELIAAVNVPLNIDHNSSKPYYRTNRALRARYKADARSRPVWTPESSATS